MSRPLRIGFAGALYHVTSRGDGREVIFLGDEDRYRFLDVLSELVHDFNWVVHAYRLMDNPYHLLIETPESNLSRGMRPLNGVYTQRFNRRHGRVGHVFQGRYKAIPGAYASGGYSLKKIGDHFAANPWKALYLSAKGAFFAYNSLALLNYASYRSANMA